MSILIAKAGRSGAGGANATYITRLNGAEKISFHNLEKLEAETIEEARTNAIAYAEAREEIELAKVKKAKPVEKKVKVERKDVKNERDEKFENKEKPAKERQVRTHYRCIFSWQGKESSEKATEEIKIFLKAEFPKARAIIAIHQDTDDTHGHVWLDARQTDGKKIHLNDRQFKTIDERWTQQYDRTYGTDLADVYKTRKEETKQWKREMYEWRKSLNGQSDEQNTEQSTEQNKERAQSIGQVQSTGLMPPPRKPPRASDKYTGEYWREKEINELKGIITNEQSGSGRSHPITQSTAGSETRGGNTVETAMLADERTTSSTHAILPLTRRTELSLAEAGRTTKEAGNTGGNDPGSSNEDRTGYFEDQSIRAGFKEKYNDNFSNILEPAGEIEKSPFYSNQFYKPGYETDSGSGTSITESIPGVSRRNSGIGKLDLDLMPLPEISFQVPEMKMDPQSMIRDTLDMVQQSLDRQGREMHELALCLYREHLNGIASTPPSNIFLARINSYNNGLPENKPIDPSGKTWLEVNHEHLSRMTDEQRDKEALRIANEFEDDLEDRKTWDAEYRQAEDIRSFVLG